MQAQRDEAAAREALGAAKYALERACAERRRLQRVACDKCAKLRAFGSDADACEEITPDVCSQCGTPFCIMCFMSSERCRRCAAHERCGECCRERHGEDGESSCEDDSERESESESESDED